MLAKLLRGDMLVCSYVPPRDVRDERDSQAQSFISAIENTGNKQDTFNLPYRQMSTPLTPIKTLLGVWKIVMGNNNRRYRKPEKCMEKNI
jgi:hypothetical protein